MAKISVITGASSGMGSTIAEILGKEYHVLVTSSSAARLEETLSRLRGLGIQADGVECNVAERQQIQNLAQEAKKLGTIAHVVNCAGIAPARSSAEQVFRVNALGTAYIVEAFYPLMGEGSVMVHFSSTAPYLVPLSAIPIDALRLDPLSPEFLEKNLSILQAAGDRAGGTAYVNAKWFAKDYAARNAARFGKKGIRILSITPGNITTPMYYNDSKATSDSMLPKTPLGRHGRPEEVGALVAFLVSDKASFLSGIDVQIDGGLAAGITLPQIAG